MEREEQKPKPKQKMTEKELRYYFRWEEFRDYCPLCCEAFQFPTHCCLKKDGEFTKEQKRHTSPMIIRLIDDIRDHIPQ